jgi:glycosyltransferase involved in cell wall biosynthesis
MSLDRTVSVIVPAYNAERYLGEAIASVRDQSVPPSEIIIVDDGSTDGTASWRSRLGDVRWIEAPHAGAAAARNLGVRAATSRFLAFLDADDRWTPEKLERQWRAFDEQPDVEMVFGHVRQFRSPDVDVRAELRVDESPIPGISQATLLVTASAFERVGFFDEQWRVGEFIDWYARAQALGIKSVVCPEVLLERRVHDDNLGIRARTAQPDYARILKAALDRRRKAADTR